MANKTNDVIRKMREQDWFALNEYIECRKKLRISLLFKHAVLPLWLLVLIFGAVFNIHWWLLLFVSVIYVIAFIRILPKIQHTIKCCTMTLFCLEIEFGFSKAEDNLGLTEEIKKILH